MNHAEVYSGNWRNKKSHWLDYLKNDVLCTGFSYARYTKAMDDITEFGMKNSLSLPGLGWKNCNSKRTEEDEPLYTNKDKYMRQFVRQSIKRGRVCAYIQYCKSKNCNDFLKISSQELGYKGKIYEIIQAYLGYKNKHFKIIQKEYEINFNEDRKGNGGEKEKFFNEKKVNFQ